MAESEGKSEGKNRESVIVAAEPEWVFDLLVDTTRFAEFVWGYRGKESGPATLVEGCEFTWSMGLFENTFRVYTVVKKIERPRLYRVNLHVPGLFRVDAEVGVTREASGSLVTVRWRYEPVSFSATGLRARRLVEGGRTVREAVRWSLASVKRILEQP
ncbi:MAG TPA: hypothetical protein PLS81_00165 [Deltaproteobacteria bacterium]|nr:hypothetical protein [Deltaproteobacteria bacterium]HPP79590.1 hypothetical protein [Deltaproteobacteria bacterium]